MTQVEILVTLENTKGKEFEVKGSYWGNGSIRVDNPRPEKYPHRFLYTEPDLFWEDDPKRLFWLPDTNSSVGEISPFRIKFMLMAKPKAKPVKKPGCTTR